ncbi:hypothetical protein RI129_000009 [Pyrocoelia pectoralis]|uniref:oxaloacetate tautomerase n=1 Tax=Pyrocoelia pectoralis TaxID=417401 RepID=A0AAN7ZFH9_9COLE
MLSDFVKNCGKVYGVAYNYKYPAAHPFMQLKEPAIFLKAPSDFITEGQPIVVNSQGYTLIEELTLGVVIGKTCKKVTVENALDYIGGYCVAFDMTALNEWKRFPKGTLDNVKNVRYVLPVSSFIPKETIPDPNNVELFATINGKPQQSGKTSELAKRYPIRTTWEIFATINGKLQQSGNTSQWVFSLAELINFITQLYTLEPNDVVFGGTAATPGVIKAGDVIKEELRVVL